MKAGKIIVFILLCSVKTFHEVVGVCILKVNEDFGLPSPVLVRYRKYLIPNIESGWVQLSKNQKITVSCPGDHNYVKLGNYTTQHETVEAGCVVDSTFRVSDWSGPFKDIRCKLTPRYISDSTKTKCYDGATLYRVGYKVKSLFYELYQACFIKDLLKTVYVKHGLTPYSRFTQTGKRPKFHEGELFGKVVMKKVYALDNQKSMLNTQLGENMNIKYITKKQAVRRRVQALNTTVIVYTGTEGVSTLQNNNSRDTEIYLSTDKNNNGIIPVPMYFYKLVYDPKRKAASAFVTINSSYHNTTSNKRLTFCNDICGDNPSFSWLKWRSNDDTHSFCCNFKEFVQFINYLPKLQVDDIFS